MDGRTRFARRALISALAALVSMVFLGGCGKEPAAQTPVKETAAASQTDGAQAEAAIVQTTCPVMEGNPIDKTLFVEYKGQKVYFCCKGCPEKFLADPEKYVAKLPQFKQ